MPLTLALFVHSHPQRGACLNKVHCGRPQENAHGTLVTLVWKLILGVSDYAQKLQNIKDFYLTWAND